MQAICHLPGLKGHMFSLDTTPEKFFNEYFAFNPQFLVIFNGLFAQPDGRLICDYLKIPALFFLVDSPFHFDTVKSPYAWISCIDRGHRRDLVRMGFERTLFMPHAVAKLEDFDPNEERSYGCVMFSSGIDYKKIHQKLFQALSKKAQNCLEEGLAKWEANPGLTLDEAIPIDIPSDIPRGFILKKLDLYLKGLKRTELLRSLDEFQIDLFGGGDSWETILEGSCPHVKIHSELSFHDVISTMRRSKVVLNSCASIRDGAHERIFQALASGCTVVAERTPYLFETFGAGKGVAYYPKNEDVKNTISLWLNDEDARVQELLEGRVQVEKGQLWEHRASSLCSALIGES